MLTAKRLRKMLEAAPDDARVITEQGLEIVHVVVKDDVIISANKPIGKCNRTGEDVYPSVIGYDAFCPELDEDLEAWEFTPFEGD